MQLRLAKYCFIFVFLVSSALFTFAADIGNYKIPARVEFAGKAIEPGTYGISIVDGQEGPYIQLSKGGEAVQKDLAIVIPARGTVNRPQVQIAKVVGQEFYRIRIRSGDSWYYAYMPIAK
jgi:hypothetical protein